MANPNEHLPGLPAEPYENTRNIFESMDIVMMKTHRRGDADSRKRAEETATILLAYPELPLVIRARACMILGCSDKPGFLEHAKEGVRIAEVGKSLYTEENARAEQLLKHCNQVLAEAQEEQDRLDQEALEQEEEEEPEDAVTMMLFDDAGNVRWMHNDLRATEHQAEQMVVDESEVLPGSEVDNDLPTSDMPTSDIPQTSDNFGAPDSDNLMSGDVPESETGIQMVVRGDREGK